MIEIDQAREAFLNMIADAIRWEEEVDGDETGPSIRFHLSTNSSQLEELCDALGIVSPRMSEETLKERIDRYLAEPAK